MSYKYNLDSLEEMLVNSSSEYKDKLSTMCFGYNICFDEYEEVFNRILFEVNKFFTCKDYEYISEYFRYAYIREIKSLINSKS